MATYEVSSTNGPKIIEADQVDERENTLIFTRSDGSFVAAFAPGHWVYFMLVSDAPEADPETVLSRKAA